MHLMIVQKYMNKKEYMNEIYNDIADELNIPSSTFDEAIKSYKALGEYLSNNISYNVDVYPQGSMNLGTIIKPIDSNDDYDLDAVCVINNKFSQAKDLKELVGNTLKKSDRYNRMIDKEGRRCWKLKYSEQSHFHMDVLPSMPSEENNQAIIITDRINDIIYRFIPSNPKGYANWFNNLQIKERKIRYKEINQEYSDNIEKLKKYNIRTPLQKTIQLLKRHRDIIYKDKSKEEKENKPISIIITTLVSRVYTGNENIVELLNKFSTEAMMYIKKDSIGNYFIENPVNPKENFADKWKEHPERAKAFFEWFSQVKYDLITNNFTSFDSKINEADYLKSKFGNETISNVYKKREARENKKFINHENVATLTDKVTDMKLKEHHFYGQE